MTATDTAPRTATAVLAGERMLLDPDRALVWPSRRTGFVGDTHFGKGAAFRRAGLAVPTGTTHDDLARLERLVNVHALEHLVVLGDFFHVRPSAEEPFVDQFHRWRERYRQLQITVIRGNHDRQAGDALSHFIDWQPDGCLDPPFVLRHEPQPHPAGHVLAGHLHPVVRLHGPAEDRLRVPVFWLRPGVTVLPAFGGFTGGYRIRPSRNDRVYGTFPGRVIALPAGAGRRC